LSSLGVAFGKSERFVDTEKHEHNPIFYELVELNALNDEILAKFGKRWLDSFIPTEESYSGERWNRLERKMRAFIRREFGDLPCIGLKDPRFCFTLPLWRRVLERMGYALRYVLVIRAASSAVLSNTFLNPTRSQWENCSLWVQCNLLACYFLRGLDYVIADYDKIMAAREEELATLVARLGFPNADVDRLSSCFHAEYQHFRTTEATGYTYVNKLHDAISSGKVQPEEYLRYREVAALFQGADRLVGPSEPSDRTGGADMDAGVGSVVPGVELQVFFPAGDGHFDEDLSCKRSYTPSVWNRVLVDLPGGVRARGLRIDPAGISCIIHLAGIAIRSVVDGRVLWHAEADGRHGRISVHGTAVRLPYDNAFLISSTGSDPQVHVFISGDLPEDEARLEIWIKTEIDSTQIQCTMAKVQCRLLGIGNNANQWRKALEALKVDFTRVASDLADSGTLIAERDAKVHGLAADLTQVRRVAAEKDYRIERLSYEIDQAWARIRSLSLALKRLRLSRLWKIAGFLVSCGSSGRSLVEAISIWRSGLFDRNYYLTQNPDVAATGVAPLLHYVKHGAAEKRNPGPLFDADYYLAQNPDVAAMGVNPLLHFVKHGAAEERNPHPLFDIRYYVSQNPDLVPGSTNPLRHFLEHGASGCHSPHPLFDAPYYMLRNPDAATRKQHPLLHYLKHGHELGRDPNPLFDTAYYLRTNPSAARTGVSPLVHYLKIGVREGRNPSLRFDTSRYVCETPDVVLSGENPLAHYIKYGAEDGRSPLLHKAESGFNVPVAIERYQAWLTANKWNNRCEAHLRQRLASCGGAMPKVSIIMPVYDPPIRLLRRAVESVRRQVYEDWEICLADDCSSDPNAVYLLKSLGLQSDKIKVTFGKQRGHISVATNRAARLATGDFLLFLDQDDELSPDALAEVALYVAEHPETDMVYSDSDKIDRAGKRHDPHFKPDWSEELLLSYMYCGQVLAVRREIFEQLRGMRQGFEGSQDHDLALRVGEVARDVGHIPKVLYHWRSVPGSTACSGNEKSYSFDAARRAVQEALERRGSRGTAYLPDWALRNGTSVLWHEFPDHGPSVTIIIPTRNEARVLQTCLESLAESTYENFRVLVVDNESDDAETLDLLRQCGHEVLRLRCPNGGFNYSNLMNTAVRHVEDEYVLFLNNDTEIVEPRWLSRMMGYARLDGVAAVGAQLRYLDGSIQHAGVLHGLGGGLAGHAFKCLPEGQSGYLGLAEIARNSTAVTAACMLTPKALFLEMGGFDEEAFPVSYNDVDYCHRLIAKGYRVTYCPGAKLLHHESKSRGFSSAPGEIANYRRRYGMQTDRYYSSSLSLDNECFDVLPRHIVTAPHTPIRLLVCTHNLNWEGAPKCQLDPINRMKQEGVICPVVLSPIDGPLRKEYETNGIDVFIRKPPIARGDLEGYLEELIDLGTFLARHNIEVVHANTLQTFYIVDAANSFDIPSVWSVHESESWLDYFHYVTPEIERRALSCFAYPYRVIFGSNATRDRFEGLNSRHNFFVIHSGLPMGPIQAGKKNWPRARARSELDLSDDETVFLSVGTVCARKAQKDIVRAVKRITVRNDTKFRVLIVGGRESTYGRELAHMIRKLPALVRDRIVVIPETDELARYYQAADAFVCTSRIECYPLAILEAMAHGLPIITTPVFGIREQVMEGVNACFHAPGDVDALAVAMSEMLQSSAKRKEYGGHSREVLASRTSFNETCGIYARFFTEAYFTRDGFPGHSASISRSDQYDQSHTGDPPGSVSKTRPQA